MKKSIITLVFAFFAICSVFAQGRFSVGPELALPMGNFGDAFGLGIGGSARYEGTINDNLNWMATAGYISYAEKNSSGVTASMIPIQGGIKYYFTESFNGFYASGDLGFSIVGAKASFLGQSLSTSETKFSLAPGIGYHLGSIDISARYQIISDASYLGFRVAYVFGGAK